MDIKTLLTIVGCCLLLPATGSAALLHFSDQELSVCRGQQKDCATELARVTAASRKQVDEAGSLSVLFGELQQQATACIATLSERDNEADALVKENRRLRAEMQQLKVSVAQKNTTHESNATNTSERLISGLSKITSGLEQLSRESRELLTQPSGKGSH